MARFTDVILKDSPDGLLVVDHIADYSDGHPRDNGSIHSTRNDPIKWPVVVTGSVTDEMGTHETTALAQEAIWDDVAKVIRAATPEELQAIADKIETDQLAELTATLQSFLADNAPNAIKFFTAMAHFPAIVLPTTYDEALDAMSLAISEAVTGEPTDTLQDQSRIAQDIYTRILEPAGMTGVMLYNLSELMKGE